MPRSLRHKSHRQHRRNSSRGDARERSDSDSEDDRRRDDALVSSSGARDSALEKRKVGCILQGPEESNVVDVGKHGVKSADLFVVVDRWSGEDGQEDGKEVRVDELDEESVVVAIEKARGSGGGDWKEKIGMRYDGSEGRKERTNNDRDGSAKRRSERDLSRSERSNQHGDVKERDRERFSDRDREHLSERRKDHDVKKDKERELEKERECRPEKNREHRQERDREHRQKRSRDQSDDIDREHGMGRDPTVARERFSDLSNRKTVSRLGDGEYMVKSNRETTERREHEEIHNSDFDKDALKKVRRRDYYGDKEKRYEDDRDITERKLSTEDRVKNGGNKDEKYREERYREKFWEDFERDEKPRYDKHRDGRPSRVHASGRSDIKQNRDENKHTENHIERRIDENGCESSTYDEYSMKYRDNKERKRFSDHIDYDSKSWNMKDSHMVETNISDSCKLEVTDDRDSLETAKVRDGADNDWPMKSFKSSSQSVKNENEFRSLVQAGATFAKSCSEEQQSKNVLGDSLHESIRFTSSVSVGLLDSHPMQRKSTSKERPHDDILVENLASSQIQTPQSDGCTSPVPSSERALSLNGGGRYSNRKDAVRHSGVEIEQKINYSKNGRGYPTEENMGQDFRVEKQEAPTANSQMPLPNSDSFPVGSISCNRIDPLSSCSASPRRPSSSVRHGTGSPASGSDGDRFQAGDRKSNNRYKRLGEINMSRGHGNATKGVLNWPSPVPNGFIPFQHGPPPGGFYPVLQPFASPMFGIRPPIDLNQSGSPFHMNENSDRFSGHSRPFGWRNPADDPFPPNLQGWDGNNVFNDGSYMNCRSDWEQKNHFINNSGSEVSSEFLKGQNGNTASPYLASDKEGVPSMRALEDEVCTGQSGPQSTNEQPNLKKGKGTNGNHSAKVNKGYSAKTTLDKTSVPSKLSDDKEAVFCSTCLSKLDVSPDLSSPELYAKWAKTVESKGNKTDDDSVMAKNEGGAKLAVRVYGRPGTSLFSVLSDNVFQGALSLYRKDKVTKAIAPLNLPLKEEMDTSETSDADKIVPVGNGASYEASLPAAGNVCSGMEIDANKLDEPTKVGQGDLPMDADNVCESKNVQGDLPRVAQDRQSDLIHSACGAAQDGQSNVPCSSASCAEGPLGCEAIIPECRVNLSRIHHSPESTH